MDTEIELVSDGDGVAIFGDPREVERFLSTADVASKPIALRPTVSSVLNAGSRAARTGSEIAANSGRWVKLTEESARALKLGKAMTGSSEGVSRAITTTSTGRTTKILEFIKPGTVGSVLTNPAMLAGAAGIMAQLAMQQTMEEITQYLALIDEKVDDVLRSQEDATIAQMVGVGWVLDDAMLKREHIGRVSEVTWSNLHGAAQTIATTQAYALRQLDALAEKLEKKRKVQDFAEVAAEAERGAELWLPVLARCFQLQDGLAILELDRLLDSSPADLDGQREAIQAGRRKRRDLISATTQRLLERMDAVAGIANTKTLLHPMKATAVVRSTNEVGVGVANFNTRLGIEQSRESLAAKRWGEAVGEARDTFVRSAKTGAAATGRLKAEALTNFKSFTSDASATIAARLPRKRDDADTATEPDTNRASSDIEEDDEG